jgi:hypothetical protein
MAAPDPLNVESIESRAVLDGAHALLSTCLSLESGDVLALFYDETSVDVAEAITNAATEIGLRSNARLVPLSVQRSFVEEGGLDFEVREALCCARGVLTCLSDDVAATSFRRALLEVGTSGGRRLGHMPGVTLSILASAVGIDYEMARRRCEEIALALMVGETAVLETYVPDSESEESRLLTFRLGGLERSPITSTGILPLGTWGNLPGGETFIAPLEDTAEGEFILNGSFKGTVLHNGDTVVLKFVSGSLTEFAGTPKGQDLFSKFLRHENFDGRPHCRDLAELGIGVNPGIKQLTGCALFDEKCSGTVHIAVGDNSRYGGEHKSSVHEDFVSISPSLWVDDKLVLSRGKYVFSPEDWYEYPGAAYHLCPIPLNESSIIRRTFVSAEKTDDGELRVCRSVEKIRACTYRIGDAGTNRDLWSIYSRVPMFPGTTMLSRIPGFTPDLSEHFCNCIRLLARHHLVEIVRG